MGIPQPVFSSSSKAKSTQTVDPKITAKAKEWFFRFQTGNIDRSQFNAQTNMGLTDKMIRNERAILKPYGRPSSFAFLGSGPIAGLVGYHFLIQFRAGRIVEAIAFDEWGKIAGLDFQTYVPN